MRTDPHTRIQQQTRQPLCQNRHSHQHPHPASPSAGCLRPAHHSREEPRHRGSSLRFLAKPKAAQLAPMSHGATLEGQEHASSRQTPTFEEPRLRCPQSLAHARSGEVYDTAELPERSALPVKVQQDALAAGRTVSGDSRGERKLLNIQHTTSSSAMAQGQPAPWMRWRVKATTQSNLPSLWPPSRHPRSSFPCCRMQDASKDFPSALQTPSPRKVVKKRDPRPQVAQAGLQLP